MKVTGVGKETESHMNRQSSVKQFLVFLYFNSFLDKNCLTLQECKNSKFNKILNLCNGLQQKKNLVKELITHEQIDILCMQETQINYNIDHSLLSFPGYIDGSCAVIV